MKVSIIAAIDRNRVIGWKGSLPWHLPVDLRFFKTTTMGHPVIMGRRTFASVGRPLPGRRNFVVTRSPKLRIPGVEVVGSLNDALSVLSDEAEVFVVGGAEIYRTALERADRMYLTLIDGEFEGDTFFPEFDESDWVVTARRDVEADAQNAYRCTFLTYDRKNN